MNYQDVKKLFAPIFKSHGYTQLSNKRLYVKDKGFGFVVFEIAPARGFGFQLHGGVCFFWNNSKNYVLFKYYKGNGGVHGRPSGQTDLMVFDFPSFEKDLEYMISDLEKHFEFYEPLTLCGIEQDLARRYESTGGYVFSQGDLGIVKLLLGKKEEGFAAMNRVSMMGDTLKDIFDHAEDYDVFCDYMVNHINESRERMSDVLKLKKRFPPLTLEQLMELKTKTYAPTDAG